MLKSKADEIKQNLADGEFELATENWGNMEGIIDTFTAGVDFYNVLNHGFSKTSRNRFGPISVHRISAQSGNLYELMNVKMKQILSM